MSLPLGSLSWMPTSHSIKLVTLLSTASFSTPIVAFIEFILQFPISWSIYSVRLWAVCGIESMLFIFSRRFLPGSMLTVSSYYLFKECIWQGGQFHFFPIVAIIENYFPNSAKICPSISIEDIPMKLGAIKLLVWILTICLRSYVVLYLDEHISLSN